MNENSIETKFDTKKITILALVAIALVGAIIIIFNLIPQTEQVVQQNKSVMVEDKVQPISKENALDIFPEEFPIERSILNSTSPQISINNGERTIVYNYNSNKTLNEIIKSFQNFFDKNKWKSKIIKSNEKLNVTSATDPKTNNTILITTNINSVSKSTEVSIIYMERLNKTPLINLFEGFPLENGVDVVVNDKNAVDKDGNKIIFRNYTSNLTIDENHDLYSKYLSSNGWSLGLTSYNNAISKNVIGTMLDRRIEVFITKSLTKSKKTDVTITLTNQNK